MAVRPMLFDTWSTLAAQTLEVEPEVAIEVVERSGVPWEDWLQENARWLQVLVADVRARQHERPRIYGIRCAEELRRRSAAVTAGASDPWGVDATVDTPAAASQRTLPFAKGAVPAFVELPAASAAPRTGSGTSIADFRAVLQEPLPFGAPAGRREPLSLERFAALTAELEAAPDGRAHTLRRFGLVDETQLVQVERYWGGELEASPELAERWAHAVHAQRTLLRG
ncbi:MAG: hypothetical protein WKG00_21950 [Polyangiaceae bacterium]